MGLVATFTVASMVGLPVAGAAAASLKQKKAEARRLQSRINEVGGQLNRISAQYSAALSQLNMINGNIAMAEKELAAAQAELERNQGNLAKRAAWLYKEKNSSFIDVIFGSKSFEEFLVRFDLLVQIGVADGVMVRGIKLVKAEIEEQKEKLESERAKKKATTDYLAALGKQLNSKLAAEQRLLSRVKGDIARIIAQDQARAIAAARKNRGGGRRVSRGAARGIPISSVGGKVPQGYKRVGDFIFPVAAPNRFSNDWGNPRSGGRRHKGTDIFAANGAPVVAPVGGAVQRRSGGRAGLWTSLKGNDGNTYYFMHMSGYGKQGQVNAGDTIGYVGSTGNASASSPHLHFELHPGGGGAANPYPHLK
ncbi:MAG: murein hydrolase activator EnvC family protein [Terriglobia bacterium]